MTYLYRADTTLLTVVRAECPDGHASDQDHEAGAANLTKRAMEQTQ